MTPEAKLSVQPETGQVVLLLAEAADLTGEGTGISGDQWDRAYGRYEAATILLIESPDPDQTEIAQAVSGLARAATNHDQFDVLYQRSRARCQRLLAKLERARGPAHADLLAVIDALISLDEAAGEDTLVRGLTFRKSLISAAHGSPHFGNDLASRR